MAKKPKVKRQLDRGQEKARKQKRIAAALGVFFVLVLVYEVPHTMKLMNKTAKAPIVTSSASAPAASTGASPAATPSSSSTPAASSTPAVTPLPAAGSSSSLESGLVSAVQAKPDPGQLTQFERFASKDPFSQSVQKTPTAATASSGTSSGSASGSGSGSGTKTQPTVPKAPPAPPPTAAVISLNGELMSVSVASQFPIAGVTFSHTGSLFQLDALTKTTAKVSIVGGSYADGAPVLTLTVGKPVTLQNTADGTRYTLILEPQGTAVPASTAPTSTTPTSTAPSLVPSSSGG